MQRKVEIVSFDEKDKKRVELARSLSPEKRIEIFFELVEFALSFRSPETLHYKKDNLPWIVLKKKGS